MENLAKKYNAEITEENFDRLSTGKLVKKFNVTEYDDLATMDHEQEN